MKLAVSTGVLVVTLLSTSLAQQFEVASVKPSQPRNSDGVIMVKAGGDPALQEYTNMSLRSLILDAYLVKDYQLSGPDWMQETLFDITARLPEGASRKEIPAMMQKLLAGRFGLKVHRETKELPVYELVVAKGGIKTYPPDKKDEPKLQPDGTYTMTGGLSGPGIVTATGTETTAQDLAELLSHSADRPVLDKTGLTGKYQFKMGWNAASGASLSDALEEQLGLKLQPAKAAIEMIVVDHVLQTPTAN